MRNPVDMGMRHERLWVVTCDALDRAAVGAAIQDQDVVFCAIGTDSLDRYLGLAPAIAY